MRVIYVKVVDLATSGTVHMFFFLPFFINSKCTLFGFTLVGCSVFFLFFFFF